MDTRIKVRHPGYLAQRTNPAGEMSIVRGRCTVAYRCREGGTDIAVVFCSPKDQFVRKLGYKTALARLESAPLKVEGINFRTIQASIRGELLDLVINDNTDELPWFPKQFDFVSIDG